MLRTSFELPRRTAREVRVHELAIVWFRRDLRLADNPALSFALAHARAVLPVTLADAAGAVGAARAASRADAWRAASRADAWRAVSLAALDADLRALGSGLRVLRPNARGGGAAGAAAAIGALAAASGATLTCCNRVWDPDALALERSAEAALAAAGAGLHVSESAYVAPPGTLTTAEGGAYRVFTPFFRAWERSLAPAASLPAPGRVPAPKDLPRAALEMLAAPTTAPAPPASGATLPRSHDGAWRPGEHGASERLAAFVASALDTYGELRDRPDLRGTSELSPHLAAGEITPRQVLEAVGAAAAGAGPGSALGPGSSEGAGGDDAGARSFVRQLAWREFAAAILHAFPALATQPLRPEFAAMPWREDPAGFERWRTGTTGYPLADAGMRQLAETGWMHNRVRLVAASLLAKHLLIDWRRGEEYFAEALCDFDPAQNAFNWQWVAGSGADAAPYFRVFSPELQRQRFDPDGGYVRRWVPEVGSEGYPPPVIDHREGRLRALAAYGSIRQG